MFFVVFVLMAQFVLVNVVVAVLMKHLEVSQSVFAPLARSLAIFTARRCGIAQHLLRPVPVLQTWRLLWG